MGTKVELICIQCGKKFQRELGAVNRTRRAKTGPFCGRSCSNSYRFSGKPLSQERREKLKGRLPWNRGKEHSPETKAKIAAKAKLRTGEKNPNWKGGRYQNTSGYMEIRVNGRKKLEHVYIMEQSIGRRLTRSEVVHHKNGDKTDNRLENLEVMTLSEHMRHHHPTGVSRNQRQITCVICGKVFYGTRPQKTCSAECKRERQREYQQRYDAKRRGRTA